MKIKIRHAYFHDGDADKAVIATAKDKKYVTFIFVNHNGTINIRKISKKHFKREYQAHNIKVAGFEFALDESGQ